MFKDKQSLGVCGVEVEVLLYAESPGEALHTYVSWSPCYWHRSDLQIWYRGAAVEDWGQRNGFGG